jgi:hypothetical protein
MERLYMGNRLLKYYDEVEVLGGLKAQMRLAVLTRMSGKAAEAEPDSPENIDKFENAMREIRKEF